MNDLFIKYLEGTRQFSDITSKSKSGLYFSGPMVLQKLGIRALSDCCVVVEEFLKNGGVEGHRTS
jgi:hypothetical protein